MDKVFHFDCPQEVYQADACVISCFDARFDTSIRKFLKRRGVSLYDNVKIPGSAKALGAPDSESDGINDHGVIIGQYTDTLGLTHGYIAVPH